MYYNWFTSFTSIRKAKRVEKAFTAKNFKVIMEEFGVRVSRDGFAPKYGIRVSNPGIDNETFYAECETIVKNTK